MTGTIIMLIGSRDTGTGSHPELVDYKVVEYRFAHYVLTVILTWDDIFIEVLGIKPVRPYRAE